MKWAKVLTCARASVFACTLLLPITTLTSAQTTTPPPDRPRAETRVETRVERDYTGLWGLLGLLGLAGLAGRRRTDVAQVYTTPESPRTETRGRH
jgi:MYXO-CTERM domain-containing protein